MSTVNESFSLLPIAEEVVTGDYFVIDNGTETRKVNFSDVIFGLENVTFASTISSNTTNVDSISSQIFNEVPDAMEAQEVTDTGCTHTIRLTINGTSYAMVLSATS